MKASQFHFYASILQHKQEWKLWKFTVGGLQSDWFGSFLVGSWNFILKFACELFKSFTKNFWNNTKPLHKSANI